MKYFETQNALLPSLTWDKLANLLPFSALLEA